METFEFTSDFILEADSEEVPVWPTEEHEFLTE